jgi:hypothetical protein
MARGVDINDIDQTRPTPGGKLTAPTWWEDLAERGGRAPSSGRAQSNCLPDLEAQ